jgi:nucleoid DNA-binding protein
MTRRNLILAITEESGLKPLQVKQIVEKIFDVIVDALIEVERVELRNFGVFTDAFNSFLKCEYPAIAFPPVAPA